MTMLRRAMASLSQILGLDDARERQRLTQSADRLEAVLLASPDPFCGWNQAGIQVTGPGFAELLGVAHVSNIDDVIHALAPAHRASVRQVFDGLHRNGASFNIIVERNDGGILRLRGSRGEGLTEGDVFDVLWASPAGPERVGNRPRFIDSDLRNQLIPALNQVPLPIWMRSETGDLLWCNLAYATALDSTIDEVLEGQTALAGDKGRGLAELARRADGAQSVETTAIVGGQRRHLMMMESYLRGQAFSIGVATDVSAASETRLELQRHVSGHHGVLEQLGVAIAVFASNRRLTFANSAFLRLFALSEQQIDHQPLVEDVLELLRAGRMLPEVRDFGPVRDAHVARFTSAVATVEELLHLPDGRALRQVIAAHPLGGLLYVWEDVTDRLALEAEFNTLIQVQEQTLARLSEAVAVVGSDGRIQLSNRAFREIWSLSEADLAGTPHISRLAQRIGTRISNPTDRAAMIDELIALHLDRSQREGQITRSDGAILRYRTMPLPNGAVMSNFMDITDSVRVESALRDRNAALEDADRLKTEVLANVSYKLRTPLTSVVGYTEMLAHGLAGPLSDQQMAHVRSILSASERLTTLIDDIVDLATIEAGYMALNIQPTEVRPLLESVEDLTREWAGQRGLRLTCEVARDVGEAPLDLVRVKQALLNLVSNAIKFTPPGGTLWLRARRSADMLVLSVADTGSGIAEADQERVFGVFVQTAEGQRHNASGIGLTLVKAITEMHGGRVMLSSAPGKGTTITLQFPMTATDVPHVDVLANGAAEMDAAAHSAAD